MDKRFSGENKELRIRWRGLRFIWSKMLYLQSIGGGGKSQVDLVKIKLRGETLKEISRAQIFISKKNYYYFTSLPWGFFFCF